MRYRHSVPSVARMLYSMSDGPCRSHAVGGIAYAAAGHAVRLAVRPRCPRREARQRSVWRVEDLSADALAAACATARRTGPAPRSTSPVWNLGHLLTTP